MNSYIEVASLKQELQKKNIKGLAVDIDETLSWTLKHWFSEMIRLFGNPENLSIEEIIKKYRYAKNVPYWQSTEALQWMEDQRESNELQTQLEVIDHADKYINEIAKIVPIAAYLTVRPISVIPGTSQWLQQHNFPKAPVIARPSYIAHASGNAWKAELLEYLYPQVDGMIDDNFEVLQFLSPRYAGNFFLYSVSEHAKTSQNVHCCLKWTDVYAKIKTTY